MRNSRSIGRGRPRGKYYSRIDIGLLEYLARISRKYRIDSNEFFHKLVGAWKNQESECENLKIMCRKRARDSAIFLITSDNKVVGQFPIPTRILQENDPLKEYAQIMATEKSLVNTLALDRSKGENPKIKDLKVGMKKVNLKARVLESPEPKLVYTRFGTQAHVSNALIADETGTIRLNLWNKQINMVSIDDVIKIENAKVSRFGGKHQLSLGRNGKLSVIDRDSFPNSNELNKRKV